MKYFPTPINWGFRSEIGAKFAANWGEMRGFDRINAVLPDDLILEVFRRLGAKGSRDACSLVCKRWLGLERRSRETIRIGASASPDALVELLGRQFPNTLYVFVDERISVTLPFQCVSWFPFAFSFRLREFRTGFFLDWLIFFIFFILIFFLWVCYKIMFWFL